MHTILNSGPVRAVKSTPFNTSGKFASKKNRCTNQFDSINTELPYAILAELSDDVLLFRCQPFKLDICSPDKNGVRRRIDYVPDYFEVSKDFVGFVQCKPSDAKMIELSKKHPDRYELVNGEWTYPAVDEALEGTGLGHKYFIRDRVTTKLVDNANHVLDFISTKSAIVDGVLEEKVLKVIKDERIITMQALLDQVEELRAEHLLWMMANNQIVVDWEGERFSIPAQCHLFESEEVKRSFINKRKSTVPSDLLFERVHEIRVGNHYAHGDGRWTVLSLDSASNTVMVEVVSREGDKRLDNYSYTNLATQVKSGALRKINSVDNVGSHRDYLKGCKPGVIALANERMKLIVQVEEKTIRPGEAADLLGVTRETFRSYLKRYRKEQVKSGCGYYGLLDAIDKRGNQTPRVSGQTEALIEEFIEKQYKTTTVKSVTDVYTAFVTRCEEVGAKKVSSQTFGDRIKKKLSHELANARHGSKVAANLRSGISPEADLSDPHGDRAFQRAHIDHTLIDMATLRILNKEEQEAYKKSREKDVNRVWLTLMVDAYSRAPLAMYLSYDAPSRASLMMVIRDCVRRYGRFPEQIVYDGGKEFVSIYFQKLCAKFRITCIDRTGKPKAGSIVERLFGTLNTSLFHKMSGNTQNTKNVRQMTREVNPYRQALWTIKALRQAVEGFLFENYITQTHDALGISPAIALKESVEAHGVREERRVDYNNEFLILTLIEESQLTRKVVLGKGVKFGNRFYFHALFDDSRWVGKRVDMRYDPLDDSYVAVRLGGEWVLARRHCREDKYHGEYGREDMTAARKFLHKSAAEKVEGHQKTQALVGQLEVGLREEQKQANDSEVTTVRQVQGALNKKMDPSNHKPERF